MEYAKYRNCLRIQITIDDSSQKRIDDLVEHCKKYGFDNVMLMLNTEEFNLGHITIEEAKPWIEMFKRASTKLRDNGISVSLNNWMEIGHCDRGRVLKENQNFTLFTDINGKQSTLIACPICENWRKYQVELIRYFVRELKPDTYWIEDDFRLHNHPPLSDIGCYCENHMRLYNQKLETDYTREEFIEKVFAKGECTPERKAFLDVNRETMVDLASILSKAVKEESPETDVALMSSFPFSHAIEGRDWISLFGALSQGGKRINRIHLPYDEINGKDYLYYFNRISMGIRALSGVDDIIILPETEHGSASTYLKSARFLRFTLEATMPLVTSGMTYSIYDFIGNGVRDSFGYGKVIRDLKPYMQAVLDLDLHFSSLSGIVIPIDEKVCYKRSIQNDYFDLEPYEYNLAATVSARGMSYRYSLEKEFRNETVFLCGSTVDCMTDEQIEKLFKNNYVIVEGSGAVALNERGLLSLISAKGVEIIPEDTGYHTYEESTDQSLVIDGIRRLRASARYGAGQFTKIDYEDCVEVHTVVKNQYMQSLAPAIVSGNNFIIWPYCITQKCPKQFCDLRRYHFLKLAAEHTKNFVICDIFGVSPYLFKEKDKCVVMLVNGNFDDFDTIPLHIRGISFNKIFVLDKNGKKNDVIFDKNSGYIEIKECFEGLSSKVLIFE